MFGYCNFDIVCHLSTCAPYYFGRRVVIWDFKRGIYEGKPFQSELVGVVFNVSNHEWGMG